MWRADCSRVTHPFAARVPRKALPLDLHVLSTPPAFVLSQDQTLHRNLTKQTTQTGTNKIMSKQVQHTVEFSKDTCAPLKSAAKRIPPGLWPHCTPPLVFRLRGAP